jgi:hypothetical protein
MSESGSESESFSDEDMLDNSSAIVEANFDDVVQLAQKHSHEDCQHGQSTLKK